MALLVCRFEMSTYLSRYYFGIFKNMVLKVGNEWYYLVGHYGHLAWLRLVEHKLYKSNLRASSLFNRCIVASSSPPCRNFGPQEMCVLPPSSKAMGLESHWDRPYTDHRRAHSNRLIAQDILWDWCNDISLTYFWSMPQDHHSWKRPLRPSFCHRTERPCLLLICIYDLKFSLFTSPFSAHTVNLVSNLNEVTNTH